MQSMKTHPLPPSSIEKVHFHWFKGTTSTVVRMIQNDYYVSVTPDCMYEEEIQSIIDRYPIERLMIETGGLWPFAGPFINKVTYTAMMHRSIPTIARIKTMEKNDVYNSCITMRNSFIAFKK